jgi:hypothetical protein
LVLPVLPVWISRIWPSFKGFQRNLTTAATHFQPHQLAAADQL